MKKKAMADANVEEGFLPKFSKEFVSHYGADSAFVRTLSDCYTNALVIVLKANNMVYNPDAVALFSNPDAAKLLSEWINSVENAKMIAFQEAMGVKPLGSLKTLVNDSLGEGRFQEWMTRLEEVARK